MPGAIDAFLAELGLRHADPTDCPAGIDRESQIQRTGLIQPVLSWTLEAAEALALFRNLDKGATPLSGQAPPRCLPL